MKEVNLPSGEYLLVEVPDNIGLKVESIVLVDDGFAPEPSPFNKTLQMPEGRWEIIGKADELTEDQWKGIVEWFSVEKEIGYRNYDYPNDYRYFANELQSGKSLITHNEYNFSKTLILRKQSKANNI